LASINAMSVSLQTAQPWIAGSVNRRILRAASVVSAATLMVKIAGLCKDVAVADLFGCSEAMDAYLAAALLPALLVNLIAESMNQALVPTLIRVREQEGPSAAQRLFSSSMLSVCLMLTAVSVVLALGAGEILPLIASHYAPAKLALAVRIAYALLPSILISGIASNCAAVLNAVDRFAWPALAPVAISLAIITALICFGHRFGIWAIVIGNLAGAFIHAAAMAWMVHLRGYRFHLRWHCNSQAACEVAGQYWPVFFSSIVASGGLLVDQSMAAMLPPGSVSLLAYANRFVSVVLTLMAGTVSTAIVPQFSRLIAYRDWGGCRQVLRTWLRLSALVSIPIAGAMIAGSQWLIRATLQHGAFQMEQTAAVAPVLGLCAMQIPFFVCSRVFYRFLVAMRRTDLVLLCGVLNLGLDIVLNLILMRWFGLAGIALATSLWTVSTFFFLRFWTFRLLPEAPDESDFLRTR
jgi:putative peptidoglycan lipid II flippase